MAEKNISYPNTLQIYQGKVLFSTKNTLTFT